MTERAKIRGVWLKRQGEDNQILKNSKNSRKPQNSLEGILLYHILITVELDLHWVKDINVSIRNFYRSHTKVQCLTVLNHYHKLLTKLPHARYWLALCTLSLTSIYSCSCFTPASETVNCWIISFSLSWCSGKKKNSSQKFVSRSSYCLEILD